jgi:hypothetical protein
MGESSDATIRQLLNELEPIEGTEEVRGQLINDYGNSQKQTAPESVFPATAISKPRAKRSNRDCGERSRDSKADCEPCAGK